MRKLALVLPAAAALLVAGCGSQPAGDTAAAAADGERLAVVATTPEVADFVRNVGGDRVSVTQIIKPNVDPHDFEPTPADLQAISEAKLVVKNGVGLEEWLDTTIEAAGYTGTVVDTSEGVTLREGGHHHEEDEHGHEEEAEEEHAEGDGHEHDPHIWHDPRNARTMVANIQQALIAADPDDTSAYTTNGAAYTAQLDELDKANEAAWQTVPEARRTIVTNHDALGYYIERYDLHFVGSVIPSLDTSAELSAGQLTDLVAKIKETGAPAVFAESSLPPAAAETIAQQAGVKVVAGEDALYGDSLGAEGTPQGTYLGAEKHNTETLVAALRG